jgi:hypothetical protein
MKLRARLLTAAVGATAVVALALPAGAVGTVDQAQPGTDGSVLVNPGLLQTFTVGRTGRLDGIQLTSPSGGPGVIQIYRVGATLPGTPLLASNLLVSLMPGQPATIGLSTPIAVTAGDVLGIGVGAVRSTSAIDLAQASGDPYAAGTLYRVVTVSSFTPLGADLQFATFVTDPAPTRLAVASLKSSKGHPSASLTVASTGAPVAGKAVDFTLRRRDGSVASTCSATTTTGAASCAVKWSMPKGGRMDAAFAGDSDFAASNGSTTS